MTKRPAPCVICVLSNDAIPACLLAQLEILRAVDNVNNEFVPQAKMPLKITTNHTDELL